MGAVKRPFGDLKTLLIGIIAGIFVVLVPGFALKAAQNTLNNDNSLPAWSGGEIVGLIIKSIMVLVIGLIYALPGIIVLGITSVAAIFAIIDGADLVATLLGGILFLTIGGLLLLVGGIFASMGLMFYAKEGSFGSAFKFGAILKKVLTVKYLISLVVIIAVSIGVGIISALLNIVPVIGTLIGFGLSAYLMSIISYTILAQTFNETP